MTGWDTSKETYTGSYTIKGTGARIKAGEDRELEKQAQEWAGKLGAGSKYNPKKELELSRWKTSETFTGSDLLDWIGSKNEQGYNFEKTSNIKGMVWDVIKTQVELFMNSRYRKY